jgi:uncharacterized protein YdeI (YjbR/CyaY-like superfamily)
MAKITQLRKPESPNGKEILVPESRSAWRQWLAENGDRPEGLWVVYRKKSSALEGPLYEDLVEEALCFGWIDSQARRLDDERRIQRFSPRRKGGLWSALIKQRVERLIDHGLMTSAGQRVIDSALADGSWSQADDVDALVIPLDLAVAFNSARPARDTYESLPDSTKKQHLWWIQSAKRASTRSTRIDELIGRLSEGGLSGDARGT